MLRETTHAALISVMTAAVITLSVQAALTFQKYRFDNGLMLGITLAAVNWYEEVARRKKLAAITLDPDPDRHSRCGHDGRFAAGRSRSGGCAALIITHS